MAGSFVTALIATTAVGPARERLVVLRAGLWCGLGGAAFIVVVGALRGQEPTGDDPFTLTVAVMAFVTALGAGLLNGWTTTGRRPEFKLVTGVSTGALIAPFAFLGPDYDGALREVYTTLTPDQVFRRRGLSAAIFDDAIDGSNPIDVGWAIATRVQGDRDVFIIPGARAKPLDPSCGARCRVNHFEWLLVPST